MYWYHGHNAQPHPRLLPSFLGKDVTSHVPDLTTKCGFDIVSYIGRVIDGLFFLLSMQSPCTLVSGSR